MVMSKVWMVSTANSSSATRKSTQSVLLLWVSTSYASRKYLSHFSLPCA